ncbi:MAG: hypothetical protein E7447_04875 [Ruminococcaceae bacterium]|nr:hypothetical protein [Oscillospiraceae bacterium]
MKKLLCILLVLSCLLGLVACVQNKEPDEPSVTVYYKRSVPTYGKADSIIAATQLLSSNRENDIPYLIRKYLATTPGDGYVSPFSQEVTLISFKLEGLTAKVVLSNELADLTGMDLTIALVCLTQTVMSLTGCEEVIISANTRRLDGQNYITLSRDSYLLVDNTGETPE